MCSPVSVDHWCHHSESVMAFTCLVSVFGIIIASGLQTKSVRKENTVKSTDYTDCCADFFIRIQFGASARAVQFALFCFSAFDSHPIAIQFKILCFSTKSEKGKLYQHDGWESHRHRPTSISSPYIRRFDCVFWFFSLFVGVFLPVFFFKINEI